MIGYGLCGSFCTLSRSIEQLEKVCEKYEVVPIMSISASSTDTRFGKASEFKEKIERITGRRILSTIKDAEPLGPSSPLDMLIVSPCTGNTLAKLASGITDSPVTMAVKAHMRNGGNTLIALATNDGLGANLKNVATMLNKKNVFFVPLIQDDPVSKPFSLVADFSLTFECLEAALDGRQVRPVFR